MDISYEDLKREYIARYWRVYPQIRRRGPFPRRRPRNPAERSALDELVLRKVRRLQAEGKLAWVSQREMAWRG